MARYIIFPKPNPWSTETGWERDQKSGICPAYSFEQKRTEIRDIAAGKSAVEALSSPVIQYPDLNSWVPAQLNEWVKDLEFTDFQKEGLLNSTDKNKYYLDTKFLYDARKATIRVDEFHNYLVSNKLLIDDELFLQFTEMENILNEVLSGATFAHQEKDPSIGNHYAFKLGMDAFPLIAKIEKMIRERLDQNFPLESWWTIGPGFWALALWSVTFPEWNSSPRA
jgi:hypothetical protein